MASKYKEQDVKVTFYDVANRKNESGRAASLASKYSTKETVNLCVKERKGMSPERFFLILAVILVFVLIIEFFGIYRPYLALEQAEKQLADAEARRDAIYDSMSDREEVRAEYRKYNYENFPSNIVDRADVLKLLEDEVFPRGKVQNATITQNVLTLTVVEVPKGEGAAMQEAIRKNKIVETVSASRTSDDAGLETVSMTVVFKNATEVK